MKTLFERAEKIIAMIDDLQVQAAKLEFEIDNARRDLEAIKLVVYSNDDGERCQYCESKAVARIDGHNVCARCIPAILRENAR